MALAPLGTFAYNGYTFGPAAETREFSAKPVYDSAERVVVYTQFSITIREVILGAPTDAAVVTARRLLSKPGGSLTIRDRGVGTFLVNVGNQRDVLWGPKPREVAFRYMGRDRACELVWKVDFCLPDCSNAMYRFAPLEFCYSATYSIDRSGLTRRTFAGHLRIPMTRMRQNNRQLPDCVDQYREKIDPLRLPGFRRIPGDFTVSEDKTRLDFSIVDEQLPGPAPPPGVIEVDASHSLSCGKASFVTWTGTVEASYEVELGRDKRVTLVYFLRLAKQRIEADAKAAGMSVGAVVPLSFSISEPQIYGKKHAAFSLSYTIVRNAGDTDAANAKSLRKFLGENGLWTRPPNSAWQPWDYSMRQALSARGVAGLELVPGDDVLLDLCVNDDPMYPTAPGKFTDLRSARGPILDVFPPPKEDRSWVWFDCHIEIESDSGVAELRRLPASASALVAESPRYGGSATGLPTQDPKASRIVNDFIPTTRQVVNPPQKRVQPDVVIYLVGKALRAGFPIPVPTLSPVAGVKPVAANRKAANPREGFWFGIVGNVGVPLYAARWRLRFLLDKVPAVGIDKLLPKNPLQGQ